LTDTGLLDTSIFIALEQRRPLATHLIPAESVVSVVTLAELRLAVINASDPFISGRRLSTLDHAMTVEPIGIDADMAAEWAILRAAIRGKSQSRVNDLWIAATALVLGVPLVTQNRGFERLAKVGGPAVILV
jgi:predicted nucleic acid-binding protein